MKKIFIIPAFTLLASGIFAQQDPYYTQFMFNKQALNPAYSGSQGGLDATLLHHQQWVKYTGNAGPATQVLGVNIPLANHGIGLNFVNDKLGYEKSVHVALSYNYRFNIGNATLGVGPSIGIMQKSLDGTRLAPEQANDMKIPATSVSSTKPDIGFGLYLQNENFHKLYIGLSASHLTQQDFNYQSIAGATVQYDGRRHYYLMAGMQLDLSPSLALRPNLLLKNDGATTQVDLNADFLYNEKLHGGLSYRTGDAMSVLVGYYITPALHLGYSYDFTLTDMRYNTSGTHEIVLNYVLRNKNKHTIKPAYKRIILSPRSLD